MDSRTLPCPVSSCIFVRRGGDETRGVRYPSSKRAHGSRRSVRPLLEDCAALLSSMETLLGHSRGVASLIRVRTYQAPSVLKKGAGACALPRRIVLLCSAAWNPAWPPAKASSGFVSYESPSTQWATQLVLSGPVSCWFVVTCGKRELHFIRSSRVTHW
jgi:hypothetical protein